jgi:hypothetical protein
VLSSSSVLHYPIPDIGFKKISDTRTKAGIFHFFPDPPAGIVRGGVNQYRLQPGVAIMERLNSLEDEIFLFP